MKKYKDYEHVVIRDDGVSIPKDVKNRRYREYLEWAKTNTPDPADPEPVQVPQRDLANEIDILKLEVEKLKPK